MRITDKHFRYWDSIVYLDGTPIVDFAWADDQTGEVMVIAEARDERGFHRRELRKGKVLEIVLDAGSSRF
jgi:hypothetical protein